MSENWLPWANFDPLTTPYDFIILAAGTQQNLLFFLNLNTNMVLESHGEANSY